MRQTIRQLRAFADRLGVTVPQLQAKRDTCRESAARSLTTYSVRINDGQVSFTPAVLCNRNF